MKMEPAMEWCVCEAQEISKILVSSDAEDSRRLVLIKASRGHFTGGAFVECAIPAGSTLIPRQNCESYKVSRQWMEKGDDRDLRLVHLRDVACFVPPASN